MRHSITAAVTCVLFLGSSPAALACTGIMLRTADGSIVHGRTVEFGITIDMSIVSTFPTRHSLRLDKPTLLV